MLNVKTIIPTEEMDYEIQTIDKSYSGVYNLTYEKKY